MNIPTQNRSRIVTATLLCTALLSTLHVQAMDLFQAAKASNIDRVRELCDNGTTDREARSHALYVAADRGCLPIVKELCSRDVNINVQYNGCTALFRAASHGHLAIVRELCQHGADYNLASLWEGTPLFIASASGWINIVEELCQCGANPNLGPTEGCCASTTPLHQAAALGYREAVIILLEYGADTEIAGGSRNQTPLLAAASSPKLNSEEIAIALLAAGADRTKVDADGRTVLWHAAKTSKINLLRLLSRAEDAAYDYEDDQHFFPVQAATTDTFLPWPYAKQTTSMLCRRTAMPLSKAHDPFTDDMEW